MCFSPGGEALRSTGSSFTTCASWARWRAALASASCSLRVRFSFLQVTNSLANLALLPSSDGLPQAAIRSGRVRASLCMARRLSSGLPRRATLGRREAAGPFYEGPPRGDVLFQEAPGLIGPNRVVEERPG